MKRVLSIVLLFMITGGLYAGKYRQVKNNDVLFKKLELSVEIKDKTNKTDKLTFTVEVKSTSGGKNIYFKVFSNQKNKSVKPVIKNGKAKVTFEIERKLIEGSQLTFAYEDGSACPESYFIKLKEYVKANAS